MKISICASIDFTYEIDKIAKKLREMGHEVDIPLTAQKILDNELTLDDFKKEKNKNGDGVFRKIQYDVIKRYYKIIQNTDAILVLNFDKNNIKNYIGGNTFLEMGFAYALNKPIYLLNPIPDMIYTDEIKAMQPKILNGDFKKLKRNN
jgi:nucleoside 2-deoxyribosyltransferase